MVLPAKQTHLNWHRQFFNILKLGLLNLRGLKLRNSTQYFGTVQKNIQKLVCCFVEQGKVYARK